MMSRFEKFDKWLGTNKGARVRFIVLLTICTLGLLYHLVGCNRLEQRKTSINEEVLSEYINEFLNQNKDE